MPFFLVLFLLTATAARADDVPSDLIVDVPVADVWDTLPNDPSLLSDSHRETQLLYGEPVLLHQTSGDWLRIEAVEQPTFRPNHRWEGYPGWIEKNSARAIGSTHPSDWQISSASWASVTLNTVTIWLPLGSRHFFGLLPNASTTHWSPWPPKETTSGQDLINTATLFIGTPYVWGGLSSIKPTTEDDLTVTHAALDPADVIDRSATANGIDCSGLTHLVFRVHGQRIPRDAHEQWMKSQHIKPRDLQIGDLIFSAKAAHPKLITHVAFYAGHGRIVEAPQTGLTVREISFKEKYGEDLKEARTGAVVGDRVLYFGRYPHT